MVYVSLQATISLSLLLILYLVVKTIRILKAIKILKEIPKHQLKTQIVRMDKLRNQVSSQAVSLIVKLNSMVDVSVANQDILLMVKEDVKEL